MKRYHLIKKMTFCGSCVSNIPGTDIEERDDGEWVRYSDVKPVMDWASKICKWLYPNEYEKANFDNATIELTAEANANTVLGDVDGACCKCGSGNVYVQYRKRHDRLDETIGGYKLGLAKEECLYHVCRKCGYKWTTPCKDSKTDTGHIT